MVLAKRTLTALMVLGLGLTSVFGGTGCAAEVGVGAGAVAAAPAATVTVDSFHTALDPYGSWVDVPGYGLVWEPSAAIVGAGFVPYGTNGMWMSTDAGWAFESDFGWGWAPFHYGNWVHVPGHRWVWVPGTTWSPACVEWRTGGGFVGWAPAPPAGVALAPEHFTFVETAHFTERNVVTYAVPAERREIAYRATVRLSVEASARGERYARGPRVEEVEVATTRKVVVHHVERPRPGVIAEVHARAEIHRSLGRDPRRVHEAARHPGYRAR